MSDIQVYIADNNFRNEIRFCRCLLGMSHCELHSGALKFECTYMIKKAIFHLIYLRNFHVNIFCEKHYKQKNCILKTLY